MGSLSRNNINDMQNKRLVILLGVLALGFFSLMISVYVQAQRQKRENIQRVIYDAEEALRNQTYQY